MPYKDPERARENAKLYRENNKEKIAQQQHEYYLANKDRLVKYSVENRRNNPDRKKADDDKYRNTHKDSISEYNKKYRQEHPEVGRRSVRKYRALHPEKSRESFRAYQQKNMSKWVVYGNNRRARIRKNGGTFTQTEWLELVSYYENKCLRCGMVFEKLSVDHIVPVSFGGRSDIENIQPLCLSCNHWKHDRTIDYRLARAWDAAKAMQSHEKVMPELPVSYEHLQDFNLWENARYES